MRMADGRHYRLWFLCSGDLVMFVEVRRTRTASIAAKSSLFVCGRWVGMACGGGGTREY